MKDLFKLVAEEELKEKAIISGSKIFSQIYESEICLHEEENIITIEWLQECNKIEFDRQSDEKILVSYKKIATKKSLKLIVRYYYLGFIMNSKGIFRSFTRSGLILYFLQ